MHFLHSSNDQAWDCASAALGYLQSQQGHRPEALSTIDAEFAAKM